MRRRRCRSSSTTRISLRSRGSRTACSTCAASRCRRTCACATAWRWQCATTSMRTASSTSRRRCSRARRPKARATISCPAGSIPASSTRYGSDKPDLRVPLELTELTDLMQGVDFKVFRQAADLPGGRVAALRVPAELTRKEIDDYAQFVATYGAKGLAYIKVNPEGLQSPIVKFLPENVLKEIVARTGAQSGEFIFFGADKAKVVNDSLGALRVRLGQDKGLVEKGWRALWVVDFPMFEWNEEEKRWSAMHHPFTSPKDGHEERLAADPGKALAKGYDLVLNGWEIGGGSVRIHRAEVQSKVFKALGISAQEAKAKFGFLLENLQYGAPPHGGIAFGLDRLVALMAGAESIRDVIAFPKTQRAQDLLVQAPSPVDEKQLRELGLRLREKPKA